MKMLKLFLVTVLGGVIFTPRAFAYVEVPYALGRLVQEATNIVLMKVEKVDREKNLIIYRKVKDVKGTHPTDVIKHNIGRAGFNPREWQFVMEAAQPGAPAVFLHNGGASETYIQGYWYQAYPGEWWTMSHGEPYLLRSYAGKVDKLVSAVQLMLTGQEVVVPCMVDGDKMALQLKQAKIQRMKASLKIQDYNAKRDFVGWGSEDFRQIAGMPAFSQYTAIARTDPEAGGVAPADFDGDGKTDLCVYGAGRVTVLKNAGNSLDEVSVPVSSGARAASWGDWNGDAKPDLLLATPTGPVLLTNKGDGTFIDDSARLPKEGYYALTTATWIDADGDKKPDILFANGFLGLRLYRNLGKSIDPKAPVEKDKPVESAFEDVSEKWGLGRNGVAAGVKGYQIASADIDADGKVDFLYSAGSGILVKNAGDKFVEIKESGITFKPSRVAPLLQDFDGDAKPDVTLIDGNVVKMFKNNGGGKFADITGQRGDLARPIDNATCLVWSDFNNRGLADLFVGVLKGPNRFLKSTGDGKFTDASEEIGLTQKVYNTRAICVVDLNNDKVMDVVFNNEGQESSVLLGDPKRIAKKAAGAE